MSKTIIIFTDLDGTLLDHNTYSYQDAHRALEFIRAHQIPLVIVSSKTKAEISNLLLDLKIQWPYIVENGSAIVFPEGFRKKYNLQDEFLLLGKKLEEILSIFSKLKEQFPIKGMHEMNKDEIIRHTGLSELQAEKAQQREFSLPFIFEKSISDEMFTELEEQIKSYGCELLKGGRFYHLLGQTNKGKAIQELKNLFRQLKIVNDEMETFGFGDAPNDLELFKNVDIPIQVEQPGGGYRYLNESVSNLVKAKGEGPTGWQWAFDHIVKPKISS